LLTVTAWLVGLNVYALLLGVTVYAPFEMLAKLYVPDWFPEVVAIVVEFCDNVSVVPTAAPAGVIVPETFHVCAVAVNAGTVAALPFTVTFWLAGLNVNPVSLGVTA
jgi:hypothetical protein